MDFSLFTTEYLYDMYECNIVEEEELINLYVELSNRGEDCRNAIFNQIEKRILHLAGEMGEFLTARPDAFRRLVKFSANTGPAQGNHEAVASCSYHPEQTIEAPSRKSSSPVPQHGFGARPKLFEIQGETEKFFKRFNIKGRAITFNFLKPDGAYNPMKLLNNGLTDLLEYGLRDISDEDYVGMYIHSSESDRPIHVSFRKRSQINPDVIMTVAASVNQSNTAFFGSGRLTFEIHHVKLPVGMGRNTRLSRLSYYDMLVQTRSILPVVNADNFCLAYALVLAIAHKIKSPDLKKLSRGDALLKEQALQLCRNCSVDLSRGANYEHISTFQNYLVDYTIVVYNSRTGRTTYFEGPRDQKRQILNLFLYDGHYDVIKSLTGFFCCEFFCELCKVRYNDRRQHNNCPYKCTSCHKSPCCVADDLNNIVSCADCNRHFKNADCYSNHKVYLCQKLKQCTKCLDVFWVSKKKTHKCGIKFCVTCNEDLPVNHLCFMKPDVLTEAKREKRESFLFIFFDTEARQEAKLGKGYQHVVNLLVSQQVCSQCITVDDILSPCNNCGEVRQKIFTADPVKNFLDYISRLNSLKKFTITIIAHNMKGYDGCFILKEILSDIGRWNPEIVRTGSKLISIKLGQHMRFIDSLNYMPMALSKLPSTFKFDAVKGYYPYLFNTEQNQNYVGPMPPLEYYDVDRMKTSDRAKFLAWYREQTDNNVVFNNAEEILTYCIGDVNILRKACLIFRECFLTSNNVDPFQEATTIASACNRVFRRNFLRDNTIAIAPKGGYRLTNNQSKIALKWLYWMEHSLNINIRHAGNGKEFKIREGLFVDGYCETTNTVYQFHGCFYHGCKNCFPNQIESFEEDDDKDVRKNELMFMRKERTNASDNYIRSSGYNLVVKWECDFRNEIKTNVELKNFISNNADLFDKEPLNPRDAFYGGRTNAVKLHHKTGKNEKICYLDVCSLYPFVNKYGKYPVGHPEIIVGAVKCSNIDINTVDGLIKCTVLPPNNLYHPVLPYRCNGKLTFPLCRSCVEIRYQQSCQHTERERQFTGTFVADELRKSIEKGYKIVVIHEIWKYLTEQYDSINKTGGLFSGYVNNFLKQKVENSGWPGSCKTDGDKEQYLKSYREREGICLDAGNICHNAGLRFNSKLMLNSFWGKFGQRENMMQSSIISDPRVFYKLLTDPAVEVHNIVIFTDDVLLATWKRADDDVVPLKTVSVAIAAYTTANARLELYKYLEVLDRRVLYFDTDSVIFTCKDGEWMPPTGDFLGEMTDEIAEYGHGSYITEFVSGGPKNYSLRIYAPNNECDCERKNRLPCIQTCKFLDICKVKGISLNFENCKLINFESMREMVLNAGADATLTVHNDRKIIRTATYDVISVPEDKTYRVQYDKRRRLEDSFDTLPYGHR